MTKKNKEIEVNFDWVNYTPEQIENIKAEVEMCINSEKEYFKKIDTNKLTFENVLGAFDKFNYKTHVLLGRFCLCEFK